jgi:hypothetical protein
MGGKKSNITRRDVTDRIPFPPERERVTKRIYFFGVDAL